MANLPEIPPIPPGQTGRNTMVRKLRSRGIIWRDHLKELLDGQAVALSLSLGGGAPRLSALAHLSIMLDELTAAEVAEQRAEGASWSTIGAALGVSKQAAQQRYGRQGELT